MLVKELSNHLQKDIIPFWRGLQDLEFGGYYGYMDNHLTIDKKAEKGAILHHRILWFFSNVYADMKKPRFLEAANHAYKFINQYMIDSVYGGSYWSVYHDGVVKDATKYTYCQAFMIYAMSSYYGVSGNKDALKTALNTFDLIESRCSDQYGYLEAFDRQFRPVENDKLSENGIIAEKTMNTLLHIFEAYTELYKVSQEKKVALKLKWILDVFINRVYNPKLKRQEVFFDKEMNTMMDLHSYGHDIETAWLLEKGCQVLGDATYAKRIRAISRHLTESIYQKAYRDKSVMNECEDGVDDTSRVWWVQAEAMIGFLNGYEHDHHNLHYFEAVENIWTYIKNNMLTLSKPSEWYSEVDENGHVRMDKPLVDPWKCPYHNGRMCLEVIKRLEKVSVKEIV